MVRVNWMRLAGLMALVVVVMAGLAFAKGGLVIAKHEGDTLHLIDIVLRMADLGQRPHLDFMTPLGVLSVAPIAWFVEAGVNLGHAFFMAQTLVAAVLFIPALYAAGSRFSEKLAMAWGTYVMVLCLALVHGEASAAVSVSMHYNRWAWALAYIVIPLALLPAAKPRPWLDGALVGAAMALLVLVKVTYFVALAPAVLLMLVARQAWRELAAAALAGLVVAGLATLAWGFEFWFAYLNDLLTVARSETRSEPGMSLRDVISAPVSLASSLTLIGGVIVLRSGGRMAEGLGLMLLVPGFFYITWQNFGNDPQWLVGYALLMFALLPQAGQRMAGFELRDLGAGLGVAALALGAGSAINLAASPMRHYVLAPEEPASLVAAKRAADVVGSRNRLYNVVESRTVAGAGTPFAAYQVKDSGAKPVQINGETLPDCDRASGFNAWFEAVSRDLEGAGYAGKKVLAADLLGAYWLYGDFAPVEGSAPWFYAGSSGIENADLVLVPLCPTGRSQRKAILEGIEKAGWGLQETRRSPLYILFTPIPPKG